ncbi:hypothetical protein [Arsenophonus nasoniae]|uniref:hypothetical protein n=1 Tax=Arsenophonus nasoniae TaxID=638 RepID=UPI000417108A|nr:hypothetical protein [Arsenophonus nasoniae]
MTVGIFFQLSRKEVDVAKGPNPKRINKSSEKISEHKHAFGVSIAAKALYF